MASQAAKYLTILALVVIIWLALILDIVPFTVTRQMKELLWIVSIIY